MVSSRSADAPAAEGVQDTNFALPPSSDTSNGNDGSTSASSAAAAAAVAAPKPTTASSRALAPDMLRGVILPLMSLDHAALFMGAWLHGTPKQSESAGTVFSHWNFTTAYVSRTLTHLCAPGFFFLMGMGCVYFHRSRATMGWSSSRMARHFVVRAVALTAVSEVLGESLMWQRHIWVINIVLIGLAVDYLLTGLLCLAVDQTEKVVAKQLKRWLEAKQNGDEETRPLLSNAGARVEELRTTASTRSHSISFWLHNAVLLLATYTTIFWNIWLSPSGGHCPSTSLLTASSSSTTHEQMPIELLALTTTDQPSTAFPPSSHLGAWFDFWFYPVQNPYVMSGFPPLAWISFCLFGMLYARVMLYKRWTPRAVAAWNLGVAAVLAALFVATRLLHFGNLSEGCLRIVEQGSRGMRGNQYLMSIKSFFYITKVCSGTFMAVTGYENLIVVSFSQNSIRPARRSSSLPCRSTLRFSRCSVSCLPAWRPPFLD